MIAVMYAGGFEDVIVPIIVFIVIIAQTIRAARKFSESKPGAGEEEPKPYSLSPEEELKEFLKRLSGESESSEEQAPPPVPARPLPVAPPRPPYAGRAAMAPPVPHATPQVIVLEPPPTPVQAPIRIARPSARRDIREREDARKWGLAELLADRHSLRQAIVLREILGPPLAFRRW